MFEIHQRFEGHLFNELRVFFKEQNLLVYDFSLKNIYIDKLDDIVSKYNNTCYSTIKIKPFDVKSSTYIDFDKKNNEENPKYLVGDHVRISKYKTFLQKVTCKIGLKKFF